MSSQNSQWDPQLPIVSVITVAKNAADTIGDTIASVIDQTYPNIEYILIDGASTDETLDIFTVMRHSFPPARTKWLSEPDTGIFEAMNKGLALATGSIVAILNADDYYSDPQVIRRVVDCLEHTTAQAVIADARIVERADTRRTVRRYSARWVRPWLLGCGVLPAHAAFFTYFDNYVKYGGPFDPNYHLGADAELMMRLLGRERLSYEYLPFEAVTIRDGGISTRHRRENRHQLISAARRNGLHSSTAHICLKYALRAFEYL